MMTLKNMKNPSANQTIPQKRKIHTNTTIFPSKNNILYFHQILSSHNSSINFFHFSSTTSLKITDHQSNFMFHIPSFPPLRRNRMKQFTSVAAFSTYMRTTKSPLYTKRASKQSCPPPSSRQILTRGKTALSLSFD